MSTNTRPDRFSRSSTLLMRRASSNLSRAYTAKRDHHLLLLAGFEFHLGLPEILRDADVLVVREVAEQRSANLQGVHVAHALIEDIAIRRDYHRDRHTATPRLIECGEQL